MAKYFVSIVLLFFFLIQVSTCLKLTFEPTQRRNLKKKAVKKNRAFCLDKLKEDLDWGDETGYCGCKDIEAFKDCKYWEYEALNKKCMSEPDYTLNHGSCMPDERGKPSWYAVMNSSNDSWRRRSLINLQNEAFIAKKINRN